jgi:hypothetical protein
MNPPSANNRLAALAALCHAHRCAALYLFGSQAARVLRWLQGEEIPLRIDGGDIDVGLLPRSGCRFSVKEKVLLTVALEDFFGHAPVDLVLLPEADPFLASNIVRGERVYAADEAGADEYDLYVLRRAGDLAPLEYERMALILDEGTMA